MECALKTKIVMIFFLSYTSFAHEVPKTYLSFNPKVRQNLKYNNSEIKHDLSSVSLRFTPPHYNLLVTGIHVDVDFKLSDIIDSAVGLSLGQRLIYKQKIGFFSEAVIGLGTAKGLTPIEQINEVTKKEYIKEGYFSFSYFYGLKVGVEYNFNDIIGLFLTQSFKWTKHLDKLRNNGDKNNTSQQYKMFNFTTYQSPIMFGLTTSFI